MDIQTTLLTSLRKLAAAAHRSKHLEIAEIILVHPISDIAREKSFSKESIQVNMILLPFSVSNGDIWPRILLPTRLLLPDIPISSDR